MSASLVGSEMCIRDRFLDGRSECTSVVRRCAPNNDGGLFGTPRSRRAVSYTHLTLPTICSV
eukprot:11957607-Alexandrium_andersonii.AAC.1